MPAILLVRHAQASFGGADYDVLSERGHEQTAALAEELAARGVVPTRVVCGSLRRQRDTAGPLAAAAGVELTTDARWDEYLTDDLLRHHSTTDVRLETGTVSSREFQDLLEVALNAWVAAGDDGPASEPWGAFATRVRSALAEVAASLGSGETAVVCTSGGALAAACVDVLGVPDAMFTTLNRVAINSGVTKLVAGRSGLTLVSYNEHAHLERDGRSLVTYR